MRLLVVVEECAYEEEVDVVLALVSLSGVVTAAIGYDLSGVHRDKNAARNILLNCVEGQTIFGWIVWKGGILSDTPSVFATQTECSLTHGVACSDTRGQIRAT